MRNPYQPPLDRRAQLQAASWPLVNQQPYRKTRCLVTPPRDTAAVRSDGLAASLAGLESAAADCRDHLLSVSATGPRVLAERAEAPESVFACWRSAEAWPGTTRLTNGPLDYRGQPGKYSGRPDQSSTRRETSSPLSCDFFSLGNRWRCPRESLTPPLAAADLNLAPTTQEPRTARHRYAASRTGLPARPA